MKKTIAEITVYFKYNNPVQNQINTMYLENKQGEHIFHVNFT